MSTLLLDKFVGANGTHLAAHTPDIGGPWVDGTAGWQIDSNQALQTVNANQSHVEVGRKICAASMLVNLNGCDPGNLIEFAIADDAFANQIVMVFGGDGGLRCLVNATGISFPYEADVTTVPPLNIAVDHTLAMILGPDVCQFVLDGTTYAICPRFISKSFVATRINLAAGALNALPGVICKQIVFGY